MTGDKKMSNKIKTIVLGATGMVGEGVLHECLKHPGVEKVLAINRKLVKHLMKH